MSLSRRRNTWERVVERVAAGITQAAPHDMPHAEPVDYTGAGVVGGWMLATRFALDHPQLARELLEELVDSPGLSAHERAQLEALAARDLVDLARA